MDFKVNATDLLYYAFTMLRTLIRVRWREMHKLRYLILYTLCVSFQLSD